VKVTKTQRAALLGAAIDGHLKRFEKIKAGKFYLAAAVGDRHRVFVRYVNYQDGSHLSVAEAEEYLAWLDAGGVGRHFVVMSA
jgi:hypothetical protein